MNLALVGQPWVPSLGKCSETNDVVPAGGDVCRVHGCSGFLEPFYSVQAGFLCNVCLPWPKPLTEGCKSTEISFCLWSKQKMPVSMGKPLSHLS